MENKIENKDKPVLIFQGSEILKKPFKLLGEGGDFFFNNIVYLRFKGDWWMIKLEIKVRMNTYATIVLFVDMFGTIRFSKDNIFSISEEDTVTLKEIITNYINPDKN